MPVHNNDIVEKLNKVADLLDIKGENQFRIRAYRSAAQTISGLSQSVSDMIDEGKDVSNLPNVGSSIADKIKEIVDTGSLEQLEKLEKKMPEELVDLMTIPNLGPKKVQTLYEELDISNKDDLEKAAQDGKIQGIEGFGEKTEEKILDELEAAKKGCGKERIKLYVAEEITEPLLDYIKNIKGVQKVDVAGSYRRRKETVGDIDILVVCNDSEKVMDKFVDYEDVTKVISKGETRSSIQLRSGLQVDLRAMAKKSYGSAMVYFTGSKAHNIEIRKMANDKDLKINEYGVFKNEDEHVAGKTEEEVYEQIGLPFINPELRENRGEIEAAQKDKLPRLVKLEDIKGDLQSHSKYSDGKFEIEEMAEAARDKGYEYLAMTDHSKRVTMAKGLDEKKLAKQIEHIDKLNEKWKNFRILKSCEVDILKDGSLDLDDEILKELDIVICSVHYDTNLSKEKQTRRVLKAMENPHFNIFAHPTGRKINERRPYEIDIKKVLKAAKDNGCFLECNAQPDRLDLTDVNCKMAKEMGVKIAISTDAHTKNDLDKMRFGIGQARRGWLEKSDVLNTESWSSLKKTIKRS